MGILELLELPLCNQCTEAVELCGRSSLHRHFSIRTRNVAGLAGVLLLYRPLGAGARHTEHPEYRLSGAPSPWQKIPTLGLKARAAETQGTQGCARPSRAADPSVCVCILPPAPPGLPAPQRVKLGEVLLNTLGLDLPRSVSLPLPGPVSVGVTPWQPDTTAFSPPLHLWLLMVMAMRGSPHPAPLNPPELLLRSSLGHTGQSRLFSNWPLSREGGRGGPAPGPRRWPQLLSLELLNQRSPATGAGAQLQPSALPAWQQQVAESQTQAAEPSGMGEKRGSCQRGGGSCCCQSNGGARGGVSFWGPSSFCSPVSGHGCSRHSEGFRVAGGSESRALVQ